MAWHRIIRSCSLLLVLATLLGSSGCSMIVNMDVFANTPTPPSPTQTPDKSSATPISVVEVAVPVPDAPATSLQVTPTSLPQPPPASPTPAQPSPGLPADARPHPAIVAGPGKQLHLAWAEQSGGHWSILYAGSGDGGRTFSPPLHVANAPAGSGQPHPSLAVAVNGTVFVAWAEGLGIYLAELFAHSSAFSQPRRVDGAPSLGERGAPVLAEMGDGTLHLAWHDSREGDWDIYYARSLDGGVSFTPALRVNGDRLGDQVDPAIAVDGQGRAQIVWADRRAGRWSIVGARSQGEGFMAGRAVAGGLYEDLADELPAIALGPGDSLHVAWANAYAIHPQEQKPIFLAVYTSSGDGGQSYVGTRQLGERVQHASTRQPELALAAGPAEVSVVFATYNVRDGASLWHYQSTLAGGAWAPGGGVLLAAEQGKDTLHDPAVAVSDDGTIHVVCAQARGDEWDILYMRSTDNGASFSTPSRLSMP